MILGPVPESFEVGFCQPSSFSLHCDFDFGPPAAGPAGSVEVQVSCGTGPSLTGPDQVGLKGSPHSQEVPWKVPEVSFGYLAAYLVSDRPPRASESGTALDPAPGPFAREAREFRPGPEQPPRPLLLRLPRRRSEPQTGNPPGPPSSRSRRCSCTKNRNRNSPRPPRAPRAPGLFVGPARRRAQAARSSETTG